MNVFDQLVTEIKTGPLSILSAGMQSRIIEMLNTAMEDAFDRGTKSPKDVSKFVDTLREMGQQLTYEKAVRCLPDFLLPFHDGMGSSVGDLSLLRRRILIDNEGREGTERQWSVRQLIQLLNWLKLTEPKPEGKNK